MHNSGDFASEILSISGLSKSFGGTIALDRVTLAIGQGEVRGLVGQNGSGKSTLIKILAGVHQPDAGGVTVHGQQVRLPLQPRYLRQLGISFVHQDPQLVATMSVLENLRVGRYCTGAGRRIRWRREREIVDDLLRRFELDIDPRTPVDRLSPTERAILAIIRALHDVEQGPGQGLLVLDEPTASLPPHDVDLLFGAIRRVTEAGSAILFVTHRLDEVLSVADRISVLRDGQLVASEQAADMDQRALITLILGRELQDLYPEMKPHEGDVVMSVRDLCGRVAQNVSLSLRAGEILGLTGLVGAGHDEVPYLIYGAQTSCNGVISLKGKEWSNPTPQRSKAEGLGLLPADRQRQAGVPRATVRENITLPVVHYYRSYRGLEHARERAEVVQTLHHFEVRPLDSERPLVTLSGGNQQKALLGRWLRLRPPVLLVHEPTQGVDVGARRRIVRTLRDAALAGTSVLCASIQYEDLAHICDRVLVFRRGRVVSELSGDTLSTEQIAKHCYEST